MEKVKKMGRSRERKVQEMGGLDPSPPPTPLEKKNHLLILIKIRIMHNIITSAEREVKVSRHSGMYQSYNF